MYQLTTSPFKIFNPTFFARDFMSVLITSYVKEARDLRGRFYTLPNLYPTHLESRFLHDYDLLKRNLAYRLAGTHPFPETIDDFTDRDYELVEDNFSALEPQLLSDYIEKFQSDCYTAHQLYRVTHVVVEPTFSNELPYPLRVYGAKGGGFSCTN